MAVLIVVSGVLVLVALVFLIIGLFGTGLGFIWASIVTSVIAGVFLLLGALQRRGTPATAADSGPTSPEMLERVTAVSVRSREEAPAEAAAADEPAAPGGGEVSVVPGRPRYHTAACRFLAGRPDVETISIDDAKGEGYTACGVCKPDAALAAAAAAPAAPAEEAYAEEPAEDTMATDASADDALAEEPAAAPARARKATAKPAVKKAAAATKAAPAKATKATTTAATAATTGAGDAAVTKAAKPAAKKAATGATVVAVPDRGKYHTETCRFASAPGALTMSKTSATRQGLVACGVCKP